MTTERTVQGNPSALPTMLKAALPALPGVNLIPGIARKGGPLPDLRLTRPGVAIDREHGRLFSVCRNKTMAVSDIASGQVIATLPIGAGVDGARFDPATGVRAARSRYTIAGYSRGHPTFEGAGSSSAISYSNG